MAVEKGQKYKWHDGTVWEVVTDTFGSDIWEGVVLSRSGPNVRKIELVGEIVHTDFYTLIREPKFKVGDRVVYCGDAYTVVVVSPQPDQEGDFAYIGRSEDGWHCLFEDNYSGLKAAE